MEPARAVQPTATPEQRVAAVASQANVQLTAVGHHVQRVPAYVQDGLLQQIRVAFDLHRRRRVLESDLDARGRGFRVHQGEHFAGQGRQVQLLGRQIDGASEIEERADDAIEARIARIALRDGKAVDFEEYYDTAGLIAAATP